MSIRVSSVVWDHAPESVRGARLLVLLVIADHASDDGTNAWPSVDTIARKARLDRRSVQRHLRALEQDGLIECSAREGPAERDDRRPNRYRVCLDRLQAPIDGAAPVSPRETHGAAPVSPRETLRGGTGVANGAAPVPPEPSLNRPEPPPRAREDDACPDTASPGGGENQQRPKPGDAAVAASLRAMAGCLPAGSPALTDDRGYQELRRAVAVMLDRGWTAHELVSECTNPPTPLRHPAAWMTDRLRAAYHRPAPRAVAEQRAAETAARLDALDQVEAVRRPADLALPAWIPAGGTDRPDQPRNGPWEGLHTCENGRQEPI